MTAPRVRHAAAVVAAAAVGAVRCVNQDQAGKILKHKDSIAYQVIFCLTYYKFVGVRCMGLVETSIKRALPIWSIEMVDLKVDAIITANNQK